MNSYFQERLVILAEECAEVQQIVAKIQRFGLDDVRLKDPKITNREHLATEMGDVLALMSLMVEEGVCTAEELMAHANAKLKKMDKWTKWSKGNVPNPNWKE